MLAWRNFQLTGKQLSNDYMEERKEKEIKYYDERARGWLEESKNQKWQTDFEGFDPGLLSSFSFCYKWLSKRCQGKKVLDYGCGNGIHSIFPARHGAAVIGIDLSESSLQIARERAKREAVEDRVSFILMDCESLKFPDNSFDIIFDGGTFSSLDLKKALPELVRVLKPDGFLIGIETFGHNPLTNLKRSINKKTGKRTGWAVDHIVQMKDLKEMSYHFNKVETKFFHLTSWITFPFLKSSVFRFVLKLLEIGDKVLLKLPFFKKYAFKVVFILSQPKKHG